MLTFPRVFFIMPTVAEKSSFPDTSSLKYRKSRSLSTPLVLTGTVHVHVCFSWILTSVYVLNQSFSYLNRQMFDLN